ncbi:hypothetical protein RUND412_003609 [Rhizina undulata]
MNNGVTDSMIEPDPTWDADSAYEGSDYASMMESETSTVSILSFRNYTYENGRRYHEHNEGKYLLPNDEAELERMDLFHHCLLLALHGELFIAPVGKGWQPKKILDIGTGSGIWAIDFAEQFPEVEVIGVDLSPTRPAWSPPNATFEIADVEEAWQFEDNSLDYIHIRHMAGHIYDWPRLYAQAFKALRPGGWIEVQEGTDWFTSDDNSIPPTSKAFRYVQDLDAALESAGMEFKVVALKAAKSLQEVGCVDVGEKMLKIPYGGWPKSKHEKELGMFWSQHAFDSFEAYTLGPFTRILGWDKKMVDSFLAELRADFRNPKYHGFSKLYCTFGRKPCV